MGGHASGEVASEMTITELFERYYNGPGSGDYGTDLLTAVREANLKVHREGSTNGRSQMGTTLTLALVVGNRVIVGNVGDSRTYLIRHSLSARITHDHSLVQDQIDMGVLTPEQAERSSIRNVITRAIGHREEVEPDFFEEELQVNDVLLLCSDGLHGAVHEDELGIIVGGSSSLADAAKTLVNLANERGGVDNISVMLIGISELGEPIPPILNERAAYYPAPPSQQITEPLVEPTTSEQRVQTISRPASAVMHDHATTAPDPNPKIGQATQEVTKPFKNPARKNGRGGLIAGGMLTVLLIGLGLLAFVVLTSNNQVSPAATVTGVPGPAQATVTLNATLLVTPVTALPSLPSAAGSIPTVTPGTRITFPDFAQIRKLEVILQNFPTDLSTYNVTMRRVSINVSPAAGDISFTPGVNASFETNTEVNPGSYNIRIESAKGIEQATVPLVISQKEASSSKAGVRLRQSSDKLIVEVANS